MHNTDHLWIIFYSSTVLATPFQKCLIVYGVFEVIYSRQPSTLTYSCSNNMADFLSLPGHGFFDKLSVRAESIDSLLCVGLDPHTAELGEGNCNAAGCKAFCLRLIEATQDVAVAYKPNAAFFEAFGVSRSLAGPSHAHNPRAVLRFSCGIDSVVSICPVLSEILFVQRLVRRVRTQSVPAATQEFAFPPRGGDVEIWQGGH